VHVLIVELNIKPEARGRFIEAITDNASHAVQEPGCLRFDVLQDNENQNKFFFYEVYKDAAALASHRESPHFARYFGLLRELIDGAVTRHIASNVYPTDAAWL